MDDAIADRGQRHKMGLAGSGMGDAGHNGGIGDSGAGIALVRRTGHADEQKNEEGEKSIHGISCVWGVFRD